jgi:hypothetical protein
MVVDGRSARREDDGRIRVRRRAGPLRASRGFRELLAAVEQRGHDLDRREDAVAAREAALNALAATLGDRVEKLEPVEGGEEDGRPCAAMVSKVYETMKPEGRRPDHRPPRRRDGDVDLHVHEGAAGRRHPGAHEPRSRRRPHQGARQVIVASTTAASPTPSAKVLTAAAARHGAGARRPWHIGCTEAARALRGWRRRDGGRHSAGIAGGRTDSAEEDRRPHLRPGGRALVLAAASAAWVFGPFGPGTSAEAKGDARELRSDVGALLPLEPFVVNLADEGRLAVPEGDDRAGIPRHARPERGERAPAADP